MGGFSTMTNSPEEFPQDVAQQMRRRGLLPALMQTQQSPRAPMSERLGLPAGTDRIQDDPVTRSNPQAYGEPQAQAPVGQSPTQRDTLSDQMWQEYQRLGQPQAPPPQPSLKDRILRGVLTAAPIALGGAFGGAYGAEGAAQGTEQSLQRQQGMRLAQQQMAQQHEQQRNSLRERMLQEILNQQRMQQAQNIADQRNQTLLEAVTQRGQNASQLQTQKAGDATTLQSQKAGDASALATQKAEQKPTKEPTEWELFMSGEQGKTPQQIVQDYAKFKQPPQRIGITFVGPDGTVGRAAPGQQIPQGASTPGVALQQGQITPATQTILQSTQPARQQVDGLLADLDAASAQGRGNDRLTMSRLGYALGQSSPDGNLAKDISALELNRVMSAARILKGSSRAYQALERAMVHTPNPWVDTVDLMRDKLRTIQKALADTEQDAIAFGTKGQTAGQATQRTQSLGAGPRPGTVEDGYRFKGGDPSDKSNWELARPR